MTRYTTRTANAYLNQYDLRVERNTATAATLTNRQVIGWWNVYGTSAEGRVYRLLTASTLTEAMEQARWHLLEGRPATIALGENSCEIEYGSDYRGNLYCDPLSTEDLMTSIDLELASLEPDSAITETIEVIEAEFIDEALPGAVLCQLKDWLEGTDLTLTIDPEGGYMLTACGMYHIRHAQTLYGLTQQMLEHQICCSVDFDIVEPESTETLQYLQLGYAFQYHSEGVTVYTPIGTSFDAENIRQAIGYIVSGYWLYSESCPVQFTHSPVDDCGYQDVICEPAFETVMTPQLWDAGIVATNEVDEDGIEFRPAYLSEAEHLATAHLLEF